MKCLFEGEVLEIIPQAGGMIFSYCKEKTEAGIGLGCKMVTFETGVMTEVAEDIYLLSKFGTNYAATSKTAVDYISAKAIVLPSGRVFVCLKDGSASLIDGDGTPLWQGELVYKGRSPSAMALSKNAFWAVYKKENVLLRYNLLTMREDLRIGGSESPFNRPNSIFVEESTAYVACPADKKVVKVGLEDYAFSTYLRFKEPVYNYLKIKDFEFVHLRSGLYIV